METRPVRRLERSRKERQLAGVCGGLGRYFDTDPVIWRLGFVLVTLMGGAGLLAYIVLAIVLPEEPRASVVPGTTGATLGEDAEPLATSGGATEDLRDWSETRYDSLEDLERRQRNRQMGGLVLIGLGVLFLLSNLNVFWWLDWGRLWPAVLIVIGLALLLNQRRG
ncbi:MAG: PspC domain-containing protein [Chloroflexota bacterium]